ncbi:MAG: ABC transporter [Acidobacteria bacterium]|mgnify:CR=1 FL=1|nr:MAG: ABC transporter [Acidobacteriota bacterium]
MEVVRVDNLTKVYGRGDTQTVALVDANLRVQQGELVALLGPSGSGKTTLLTSICCINEPTRGRIELDGTCVYDDGWTGVDVRAVRRQKMGVIFQAYNLIPFLTVLENVALILTLNGVGQQEAQGRALELLEYLEMESRWQRYPSEISGGERQRVAIARALANNPKVLLADEPTAALDTARGKIVMSLLRKLSREKEAAVIVVTHDERMVEGFDRIYNIADGRIQ